MACIKFSFNHQVLSARLCKNKEFMKPVWVIVTRHNIGINVMLCSLNHQQKEGSVLSQVLYWLLLLPAQKHLNIRISTWVQVLVHISGVTGSRWYGLTLYSVSMICGKKCIETVLLIFLCSWSEKAEIGMDTMVSLQIFYLYVCFNRRQFCLCINTLWSHSKEELDQRQEKKLIKYYQVDYCCQWYTSDLPKAYLQ